MDDETVGELWATLAPATAERKRANELAHEAIHVERELIRKLLLKGSAGTIGKLEAATGYSRQHLNRLKNGVASGNRPTHHTDSGGD